VGDALKIEYEGTTWKGKTIFNLKGILDYVPAEEAPSNGGNDKMTKEDWARKDDRIAWESIFASLCSLLSGGATSPKDAVAYADEVFEHFKEKFK
jgi:hypothetical protein